jgi:hypothetical protein
MSRRREINQAFKRIITEAIDASPEKQEDIATALGVDPRNLGRMKNEGKVPNVAILRRLPNVLPISLEQIDRAIEEGRNESPAQIFQWYRENRQRVAQIARAYYEDLPDVLPLPMVTVPKWLPHRPIPLREFDLQFKGRDSWIETEVESSPPTLKLLGDQTYSRFLEKGAPTVEQENRFCYRLVEVSGEDNTLRLKFSPSRYQNFVNSCEALGYELAEWCIGQKDLRTKKPRSNGRDLSARKKPQAIFNLSGRSACPGISTILLLLNAPHGDSFFLHERTPKKLLDSPGGWHVVPAGQFQPDTAEDVNHDRDFSIERTVMRELGEELLGIDRLKDAIRTRHDFYSEPKLEPFIQGLGEGVVRGYFLGLGFDPLPTKPGILTALVIDASRMPPSALEFIDNWEGKFLEVPLTALDQWSRDPRLIPDGATCLQLAKRHLPILLNR